MGALRISVYPQEKRLEAEGAVAFGESVPVTVAFPDGGAPESGDFRLRIRFMGADVAAFPMPNGEGQVIGEWTTIESDDEWTSLPAMTLNTTQLRACFPLNPPDGMRIQTLVMLDCVTSGGESLHAEGRLPILWWSANQTLLLEGAPAPVDIGEWATAISNRIGDAEDDIVRLDNAFSGYVSKAKIAEALAVVGDPSVISTIGGVKTWMASLKGAIASLATAFAAALFLAAPLCGATLEDMPLNAELMTSSEVAAAIAGAVANIPEPDFSTNNMELATTIRAAETDPEWAAWAESHLGLTGGILEAVEAYRATIANSASDYIPGGNIDQAIRDTDSAIATRLSRTEVEKGFTEWKVFRDGVDISDQVYQPSFMNGEWNVEFSSLYGDGTQHGTGNRDANTTRLEWFGGLYVATRTRLRPTPEMEAAWDAKAPASHTHATNEIENLAEFIAAVSPVPDLSGYATSAGVTNIVHDLSLGGIWDEQLQVWWAPRMRNGSLTYEATTNVNLNAGN